MVASGAAVVQVVVLALHDEVHVGIGPSVVVVVVVVVCTLVLMGCLVVFECLGLWE